MPLGIRRNFNFATLWGGFFYYKLKGDLIIKFTGNIDVNSVKYSC